MEGHADFWEIRVTRNYRIVFLIEGDEYILYKIGKHDILKNP